MAKQITEEERFSKIADLEVRIALQKKERDEMTADINQLIANKRRLENYIKSSEWYLTKREMYNQKQNAKYLEKKNETKKSK